MNKERGIELPSWIFEVDDEDEINYDKTLLEELEIDIAQIYRCGFSNFPLRFLFSIVNYHIFFY